MKKVLAGIAIILSLFLAATYVIAVAQTSYSNDKDNYRFISDIKTRYTADESKDIQISFIDTSTGEKPAGVSVLMQVNNGPTQTVLSASSQLNSRFVNLGNLNPGVHSVRFTLPEACGNFFDYSLFNTQTRFYNRFDCEFVRQFSVAPEAITTTTETCTDNSALNTGEALPCVFDELSGCTNSVATNYNRNATVNDGSCIFPLNVLNGCTDSLASNYVPTAQNDNGSCQYYIYGCTDSRADNYNSSATASDASCNYPGEVTASDFECSANRRNWTACGGRTFTLISPTDTIYVRTEPVSAGVWSDWCTGDLNNGVQASFDGLTSNNSESKVSFTFAEPGSLFDMTLCLNPATTTKSQAFERIKLKLLDTKFIES